MKHWLFSTEDSYAGLLLRLGAGSIMLPHGAQKMLGLFGGDGYRATMDYFTQTLQLPWIIAFLVIIIEYIGSLCLIGGFGTKLWAFLLIVVMAGVMLTTSGKNVFFMNWFGTQQGEGFEYHLLFITICLTLLVTGSGKWGVDHFIQNLTPAD